MEHKLSHPYALTKDGIIYMIIATDHDEDIVRHLMEFWECNGFVSLCDPKHIVPEIGGDFHLGRSREPKPYPSWNVFNESTWNWSPPIPYPTDNKFYKWDESNFRWTEIVTQ